MTVKPAVFWLVSAVALSGCAATNPPELDFRRGDADTSLCQKGSGPAAIAACERAMSRPDPINWPGLSGTATAAVVYAIRVDSALALGRHLSAAGREADAAAAVERAVGFARAGVRIGASFPATWATLGVAENRAGRFQESSEAFARALALQPTYFTSYPSYEAALRSFQRQVWEASQQGRRFELALPQGVAPR
jgi:tetratricopeptide (TPR) repeat protein